ncbi:Arabinanase/levansucrase/invertase [Hymenopellis radicata]|nr:Arabinanase/levansucrase/invertase [Hymenopellis radicata]
MLISLITSALLPLIALAAPLTERDIEERSISGVIIDSDFPDPTWYQVGDSYWAFSTTSGGLHVPMATSSDFNTWTRVSGYDALPTVGAWSTGNDVWAPDVVRVGNGFYIMYYSAESTSKTPTGKSAHCFGAAWSTTPQGPYTPIGDDAIQCHLDQGGAIDPAGFQDHTGRQFIVYKIDGNNMGNGGSCNNDVAPIHSTPLMLQEVDPKDGYSRIGDPVQILDRGDADGPLIEAPSLLHLPSSSAAGGYIYYLFFSSNCYSGGLYDTSYATSVNGVTGPYVKSSAPLMVTGTAGLYSPGGADVEPGGYRVMFHADQATSAAVRVARAGTLTFDVGARTVSIESDESP